MTAVAAARLSYADYLQLEAESGLRHVFWSGEVWAMSGGSADHARIAMAVAGELHAALKRGPCRSFSSDLKLWLGAADMAVYPDLSVICGPVLRPPHDPQAATNPRLVVEVLSPSTRSFDLSAKRMAYQRTEGLEHILFIESERVGVELWTRGAGRAWQVQAFGPGERVALPGLGAEGLELEVDALYLGTELLEGVAAGG
jgi:Uma2 family endonuclease